MPHLLYCALKTLRNFYREYKLPTCSTRLSTLLLPYGTYWRTQFQWGGGGVDFLLKPEPTYMPISANW